MKRPLCTGAMVWLFVLLSGSRVTADIIGTVDENGNGSSLNTGTGEVRTFSGQNGVDPFDPSQRDVQLFGVW